MKVEGLQVESKPNPADVQFLSDQIIDFNVRATGFDDGEALAIFARDDRGQILLEN
jgi:hypothetical protein